jgi:hypothetical protein
MVDNATGGPVRCAFKGCPKTSERPFADGWADLAGWGPGVPDGLYCREHTAALEALLGCWQA